MKKPGPKNFNKVDFWKVDEKSMQTLLLMALFHPFLIFSQLLTAGIFSWLTFRHYGVSWDQESNYEKPQLPGFQTPCLEVELFILFISEAQIYPIDPVLSKILASLYYTLQKVNGATSIC